MLSKLKDFCYPESITQACELLGNKKHKTAIIAGGTSEALKNDSTIEVLIDINKIKSLQGIKKTKTAYQIGAATKIQDIYKSELLKGAVGDVLKDAAGKIGSTLLRNCISAGGNLVATYPWSNLSPVYMVLDASVICADDKIKRTIPVVELLSKGVSKSLKANEIITQIEVPSLEKNTTAAFKKFSRTANDYSLITVAVRLTIKNKLIETAKVALNGIIPQPKLFPEAEKILVGNAPSKELFDKAAKAITSSVKARKDYRASEKYRKEILPVLISRTIQEAAQKAN